MEKILLIIPDWNLRQLYHELLLSIDTEIIPADSIDDSIMLLTIERFDRIVLYTDNDTLINELFLKLRRDRPAWRETRLVLLTPERKLYEHLLEKKDTIVDPLQVSPEEIARNIKNKV